MQSGGARWSVALTAQPRSPQSDLENARVPLYLGATYHGQLPALLDYERWETLSFTTGAGSGDRIQVRLYQDFPLIFPLHRAFYAADEIRLEGRCNLENHASLYLENTDG